MWGKKSGRTSPLHPKWRFIRSGVLKRDNYRCVRIREDTGEPCDALANQVNHIGDPDDYSWANLESLCEWHHDQHTAQRGGSSTRAAQAKHKRKTHPGVMRFDD